MKTFGKIPISQPSFDEREVRAVMETLRTGWVTQGPKVAAFEAGFARTVRSRYAVAVSSCSAALELSLRALDIGPGDEVITTPFTFVSTAAAIVIVGARPVFADIDPNTWTIDPEDVKRRITRRTRAIIAVDYAGQPANYRHLMTIARRRRLPVIADAAHSLGARLDRRPVGTLATLTCFSFYATKNISTGDGGMVTTGRADLARRIRLMRLYGMDNEAFRRYQRGEDWRYAVVELGYKRSLTDIQAAIGLVQLRKLGTFLRRRRAIAKRYDRAFAKIPGIIRQGSLRGAIHSHYSYPMRIDPAAAGIDRDTVIQQLIKWNIHPSVHFLSLHLQPFYRKRYGFRRGNFPNTERVSDSVLSLPLYPTMSDASVRRVITTVRSIVTGSR